MDRIIRKEIEIINQSILIELPDSAISPREFVELNVTQINYMMKQITETSIRIEKMFHFIIKLILYRINDKYSLKNDNQKFDFFNVVLALEDIKDSDGVIKCNSELQLLINFKFKDFVSVQLYLLHIQMNSSPLPFILQVSKSTNNV